MGKIQIECIVFKRIGNKIEYLLLKRRPEKGNFWQPPCGVVEKQDKSKLDGAYRELFEEANISEGDVVRVIKEVHSFEMNKHYLTGEKIEPIKEYVYGFEVIPNIEINIENNHCKEHTEFKWARFQEALKLLKWDNNKVALTKLDFLLNSE